MVKNNNSLFSFVIFYYNENFDGELVSKDLKNNEKSLS